MRKPPIIILNPDEMRWDSMGHMGNPAAKTPFLDEFAEKEAVSFRNAYCQNPVCVPSRCSFLTGLYPHVRGHRTMSYLLHEDETSLFQELKAAGYYIWMNGRNDLLAGQIPGLEQRHADEIYYYDKRKKADPPTQTATPKDMVALHKRESPFPFSHFHGLSQGLGDSDMQDTLAAIERILNPVDNRPLCLFLGWTNTHPPYQAEEPYFSSIDRTLILPRIRYEGTAKKSIMIQRIRELADMGAYTEEQWTELRAVYLAQCNKVDTMCKTLCDALKQAGIYDESAIFILSDHGDFCGDFDLPEKAQNTFEDCLTKVPLLIKPPKGTEIDPGVTDSLVELVDFYATVMDYACVNPSQDHFGRSLRPIVKDRTSKVRDFVCCEGGRLPDETHCVGYADMTDTANNPYYPYWPKQKAQCDADAHEKGVMIFDGRYKYVHRPSGRNEFYDLQIDPAEKNNIFDEMHDHRNLLRLKCHLLDWYQQTCDIVPRTHDSRFTADRLWAIVRFLCPPEKEAEVRSYIEKEHPPLEDIFSYVMAFMGKKS
jgi:arylsulfatase A-like enzyme